MIEGDEVTSIGKALDISMGSALSQVAEETIMEHRIFRTPQQQDRAGQCCEIFSAAF